MEPSKKSSSKDDFNLPSTKEMVKGLSKDLRKGEFISLDSFLSKRQKNQFIMGQEIISDVIVNLTPEYAESVEKLGRKYPHIDDDLAPYYDQFKDENFPGVRNSDF